MACYRAPASAAAGILTSRLDPASTPPPRGITNASINEDMLGCIKGRPVTDCHASTHNALEHGTSQLGQQIYASSPLHNGFVRLDVLTSQSSNHVQAARGPSLFATAASRLLPGTGELLTFRNYPRTTLPRAPHGLYVCRPPLFLHAAQQLSQRQARSARAFLNSFLNSLTCWFLLPSLCSGAC